MAAAVFYLNDPAAPKPNRPAHLGVNILLEWDGKLLLERRRDCGMWGLPGAGSRAGSRNGGPWSGSFGRKQASACRNPRCKR